MQPAKVLLAVLLLLATCTLHAAKKTKPPARYWKLNKDQRQGPLTEKEYRFIRKHLPTGDPLRGLTVRELEAIDPWYRDDNDIAH